MYNLIYDYIDDYMGFFSRVEENDISINKKSIEDIDLLQSDKNYYPVGDSCFNKLDKFKVELINQKKMKLIIMSDNEALQKMTLDWAVDMIKGWGINSKQVIFLSYDLRSDETYRLLLKEFPKFRKYPLSVIGADTYCFEKHSGYGDLPTPTDEIKPYRYVCYNANAKEYRMFIVTELFRRGLDKQGLISLLFRYGSPDQICSDFVYDLGFDVNDGIGKLVDEYAKTEMVKRVPLILDRPVESVDKNDRPVDVNHIKNSYFNIITESYMFNNTLPQSHKTIFEMSEKTYKAIVCQPFIHLGSYGVLRYMRSRGYHTFPELFDESYDDIIDHKERLLAVVNSVEKVCKMNDNDFHDIYCRDIIPKVVHNRNLSKSKELKQKIWDEFIGGLTEL